jgi:1,4-alpha-glucan branching enzyme
VQRLTRDLNRLYTREPALHELDCDPAGFEWAVANDAVNDVIAFFRKSTGGDTLLVAANLTPVPRHGYRIGVPEAGRWAEVLNTDSTSYGGSGQGNLGVVVAGLPAVEHHGRPFSVDVTLPPLAVVVFRHEGPIGTA